MVVGRGRSGTRAKKKGGVTSFGLRWDGQQCRLHPTPATPATPLSTMSLTVIGFAGLSQHTAPHLGHSNSSIPHAPALPNVAPRTTPTHPSRTLAPTISSKFCGKVGTLFEKATEMILQKVAKKIAKRKAKKNWSRIVFKTTCLHL